MNIFSDQLNRKINLHDVPGRIVSLVPSQTELLSDLGLKDHLFGVTKFCVHPKELRKEKTVVGGTKQVHLDKIRSLQPGIILCNKEENTEEMVLELEQVAPVHVSDVKNIDDSLELILQYGEIFQKQQKASSISEEILRLREEFENFISDFPKRRVAYFIWQRPYMVAGKDTFINHLLELNRLENVFSNEDSRYPEVDMGELKKRNVDLVLLSSEPFPFGQKHVEIFEEEESYEVHLVDGEYFSWYGSRLLGAFRYFRGLQSKFGSF